MRKRPTKRMVAGDGVSTLLSDMEGPRTATRFVCAGRARRSLRSLDDRLVGSSISSEIDLRMITDDEISYLGLVARSVLRGLWLCYASYA